MSLFFSFHSYYFNPFFSSPLCLPIRSPEPLNLFCVNMSAKSFLSSSFSFFFSSFPSSSSSILSVFPPISPHFNSSPNLSLNLHTPHFLPSFLVTLFVNLFSKSTRHLFPYVFCPPSKIQFTVAFSPFFSFVNIMAITIFVVLS